MAERRMLSSSVIKSNSFKRLSDSARLGWFYLLSNTDAYGFVVDPVGVLLSAKIKDEPEAVIDELKQGEFVISFNEDLLVLADFQVGNKLDTRSAQYHAVEYARLIVDDHKRYVLRDANSAAPQAATTSPAPELAAPAPAPEATRPTQESVCDYIAQHYNVSQDKALHILKYNLMPAINNGGGFEDNWRAQVDAHIRANKWISV